MKKSLLVICSVLIFGITGCSITDKTTSETDTTTEVEVTSETDTTTEADATSVTVPPDYNWLPVADEASENEKLLYDKFNQKIVNYNIDTKKVVEKNEEANYFQYGFNDLETDIYTTGNSVDTNHNYKIIKMLDKKTETLYEMKDNEGIFPLAYKDEENMYFIKCTYGDDNKELYADRVICKFNEKTKKLEELDATKGLMTSYGVVIDDLLYFTVYEDINYKDYAFTLNKMDLNANNNIKQVDANLAEGEVYNNNGKLWVSDKANIYEYENNKNKYPKKSLNYFYKNELYQLGLNDEHHVSIAILSEGDGKVEFGRENVIDVRVEDGIPNIYSTKTIISAPPVE